jgi:hypothetical protein
VFSGTWTFLVRVNFLFHGMESLSIRGVIKHVGLCYMAQSMQLGHEEQVVFLRLCVRTFLFAC